MSSPYTILVTGANSGLGFSTCCRLIDEFLATRPATQSLHLIFTTRDKPKSDATLKRLQDHLRRTIRHVYGAEAKTAAIREMQEQRIRVDGEIMDLCLLPTVKRCAARLVARNLHIDVVVLNAGIGGWTGLNYPLAVWSILTGPIEACTTPSYKIGTTGKLCKPQLPSTTGRREPPLGEVFAANVFGHYMFVHWLIPALSHDPTRHRARIVWTSSIESKTHSYVKADIQSLLTDKAYESSKRLTEILALTSSLPSTQRSVSGFLPTATSSQSKSDPAPPQRPEQYLAHPGVCFTPIAGLPHVLTYFYFAAIWLVRIFGSPWHTIYPYTGAVSAAWLALAAQDTLDSLERDEGKAKWGSAADRTGGERVVRTEVDGWGWGGRDKEVGDKTWRVRAKWWLPEVAGQKYDTVEFEQLGVEAWREMEDLRVQWEEILKDV